MTTTTELTVAEQIAERFDNDGSRTVDPQTSESIRDVCESLSVECGNGNGMRRYIFNDKSAILICGGAWDLGYPNCYCWQSSGHSYGCPNR